MNQEDGDMVLDYKDSSSASSPQRSQVSQETQRARKKESEKVESRKRSRDSSRDHARVLNSRTRVELLPGEVLVSDECAHPAFQNLKYIDNEYVVPDNIHKTPDARVVFGKYGHKKVVIKLFKDLDAENPEVQIYDCIKSNSSSDENVVRIYGMTKLSVRGRQTYCVVLKRYDYSLSECLAQGLLKDVGKRLNLLRDVLRGLKFLHRIGISHGNVNPEVIVLDLKTRLNKSIVDGAVSGLYNATFSDNTDDDVRGFGYLVLVMATSDVEATTAFCKRLDALPYDSPRIPKLISKFVRDNHHECFRGNLIDMLVTSATRCVTLTFRDISRVEIPR